MSNITPIKKIGVLMLVLSLTSAFSQNANAYGNAQDAATRQGSLLNTNGLDVASQAGGGGGGGGTGVQSTVQNVKGSTGLASIVKYTLTLKDGQFARAVSTGDDYQYVRQ